MLSITNKLMIVHIKVRVIIIIYILPCYSKKSCQFSKLVQIALPAQYVNQGSRMHQIKVVPMHYK